jgi:hypothetical protein
MLIKSLMYGPLSRPVARVSVTLSLFFNVLAEKIRPSLPIPTRVVIRPTDGWGIAGGSGSAFKRLSLI